ncbi:MAG: nucleoside triphosphate pyrophosphohydrolase [Bacteroidetes bacterium QS_9_68_14]|nr:MAG: nucleoside triphosphate pyrophosphohydrolase [Bacteroidetes bacterium QS_9_68_14]
MPDAPDPEAPVYEDSFRPSDALAEAFADFVAVVRQLRRDCPWDREQTHASTRSLTLEEAYEVADAIDAEDAEALEGELGDLLLHGLFHSRIAEEAGRFTLEDVLRRETRKLIRRHPHVFGEEEARNAEDVEQTWEAAKRAEREKRADEDDGVSPSALDDVPEALPALLKAARTQQKAAGAGFDFATREASWAKVEEELREFRATEGASPEEREEELGDLLFALTAYARREELEAEDALRNATAKFARRFRYVEQRAAEEATREEMRRLWDEASGRGSTEAQEHG